ncbi:MAG: M15 family metallopeptidase [Winogradskyella sp.]|uniref:M15 family metallopeptidase n=1 Tax=Winogradskyella sp. TaxID=1883156 RepID=UPI00385E09A7
MKLFIALFSLVLMLLNCKDSSKTVSLKTIAKGEVDIVKVEQKPITSISETLVLGKFDYKTDSTFVKVSPEHSTKTIYLNQHVYDAFLQMHQAAQNDGIDLIILSGTRNFKEQKTIWERKWQTYSELEPLHRAQKILEYSAMPSSSRHHWGTDLDLNSLSNSYFSSGKGKTIYNWLNTNANDYGFYQVYINKNDGRTGYNLEKWHWSYLPLASDYLDFYNAHIKVTDITGFKGAVLAEELNIITNYVNGIAEKAKSYK